MSSDNLRRCSGCNETGHNIRTCIKFLDENIILEYSRRILTNVPTIFPPFLIPTTNKLNKLCEKYGLFFQITDSLKIERLHNIYLHLGRQHRRNIMNENIIHYRNNLAQRPNIYRPSYLPLISEADVEYTQRANYYLLNGMPFIRRFQSKLNIKPTYQIIFDKDNSKLIENNHIGECPICYEQCNNMISTDCNHHYCQPCISKLINTINKIDLPCPMCRENIKNIYVFSDANYDLLMLI